MTTALASLEEITKAFNDGLIDGPIANAMKRKILGLAEPQTATTATTVTQEDPTTRAAKEIRAAISSCIGSVGCPRMGKRLYDSTFTQAVDETVRTSTTATLAGSPLQQHFAEVFRLAGADTVPTCLEGSTPSATVARLAAREWLAQVVGPFCAWEMWKSCPSTNRAAASSRIIAQIRDDDANSTGFVLLSNINKIGKQSGADGLDNRAAEEEQRRKRQRDQQTLTNQHPGRGGGGGRGGSGGGGGRGGGASECFFCGISGHRQKDCADYAEQRKQAGGH